MNSDIIKAEKLISSYSDEIKSKGFAVSGITRKQYNYEISISRKDTKIKLLVYFGKKGISTIIQGNKDSGLYGEIAGLIFGESFIRNSSHEIDEPDVYLGTDESGKGDYFGPLVIAGVFIDKETSDRFKKLGVKDSKELSDNVIKKYAEEIKSTVGDKYEIISISPPRYNELYAKIGNVNRILGWAHARVLENLLERCPASEAISDKFGDEKLIINSLQENGKKIVLHQFTKAERFTAVAAASVLARDKFNGWFDKKKKELKINLLKGASAEVEKLAAKIMAEKGEKYLYEIAKVHFKTTAKIIRSNY